MDAAGARRGQARALREAVLEASRPGRAGVRPRGGRRARSLRGVHVASPPADREARAARRRRGDRPLASRPRRLQLPASGGSRSRGRALRPRPRRRLADGRRLLLPERDPAAGGRAGAVARAASPRADRDRRLLRRGSCASRRPARPFRLRLRAPLARRARSRRRGGKPLRHESLPDPVEPANSYRLELENVSGAIRGRVPLLLGREDALGQARAIEALYRSASAEVPTTDWSAS
jgi:hypothetical protein